MNSKWINWALLGGIFAALFGVALKETGEQKPYEVAPLGSIGQPPPSQGAPKITALAPDFDFGSVKQGSEVVHVFKVRNDGKANLVVKKATSS